MKEVKIYTDGACSGNPGPGGWAAVMIYKNHKKEISGREDHTTNNRMELTSQRHFRSIINVLTLFYAEKNQATLLKAWLVFEKPVKT